MHRNFPRRKSNVENAVNTRLEAESDQYRATLFKVDGNELSENNRLPFALTCVKGN